VISLVATTTTTTTTVVAIVIIIIRDDVRWEQTSNFINRHGLQMNGSRAGELGLENALSAKTKSGASSDRTNIQLHGRIEAQQAVPVYQHGLVSPQGLLDNGPHCYEEGPFSVFNRLYDDWEECEPNATFEQNTSQRITTGAEKKRERTEEIQG